MITRLQIAIKLPEKHQNYRFSKRKCISNFLLSVLFTRGQNVQTGLRSMVYHWPFAKVMEVLSGRYTMTGQSLIQKYWTEDNVLVFVLVAEGNTKW